MVSGFSILVCIALLSVFIAGCTGAEGFGLGWDYQDMDGDHIRNGLDFDVDGDGVENAHDVYPLNPHAY